MYILNVIKRNPLYFHSISCKNNGFFLLPNIYIYVYIYIYIYIYIYLKLLKLNFLNDNILTIDLIK